MKKIGIIYKATNEVNGMMYIGQTIRSLKIRKRNGYNPYFQNAINKYGDKIKWEIIGEYSIKQLDSMECYYIQHLHTIHPNGYNFDSGGNKNKIVSEETKAKLSKMRLGKHLSQKVRDNMSKARLGKKHSEEVKQKMSVFLDNSKYFIINSYQLKELLFAHFILSSDARVLSP
ncbi:hypothetical protein LCGC14_1996730, partial [marine sediment metagenome]